MYLLLTRYTPKLKAMGNIKSCFRNNSSSHHLERTANQPRSRTPFYATIQELWQITPTIKGVRLEVDYKNPYGDSFPKDAKFTFKPGQWVDFLIMSPDTKMVGGYSMVSLPDKLPKLDLAVKASSHPPAEWVTQTAKVGDRVVLKVGGNFFYPLPKDGDNARLLLVAGGIGINPLYCMLHHLMQDANSSSRIVLLYAAKTVEELAFRQHLEELAQAHPENLRILFTTTSNDKNTEYENLKNASGRFSEEQLGSSAEWLGSVKDIDVLVCGPKGMPEAVQKQCGNVGISRDKVLFEKWW